MRKFKICCIVFLFVTIVGVSQLLLGEMIPQYKTYIDKLICRPQIKIFVTYYKPYDNSYNVLKDSNFMVPIQVGRAIEKEPFMGGQLSDEDVSWLHERMIGDDTGDNISAKNREYDVLTAYYWVWKHYKEIGNPKYIGFAAHRKWLYVNPSGYKSFVGVVDERAASVYQDVLDKHKVITYYGGVDLYKHYEISHVISDLDVMIKIIKREYPEMSEIVDEVLFDQKHDHSLWNFWIMEKELAFDYFEKLFHVISEVEKEIGEEIKQRDFSTRRAYGHLAERFFPIWLEYQIKYKKISPFYTDYKMWTWTQ